MNAREELERMVTKRIIDCCERQYAFGGLHQLKNSHTEENNTIRDIVNAILVKLPELLEIDRNKLTAAIVTVNHQCDYKLSAYTTSIINAIYQTKPIRVKS